eukprot:scaffold85022_cov44-Cyclotella_meneghiniana.AAC.2
MEAQLYLRLHYQTSVTATVPTSVISQCYPSARINREPNPKSPLILSHRQSTIKPTYHQVNLHQEDNSNAISFIPVRHQEHPRSQVLSASNSTFQTTYVSYFIFKTTPYPTFNRIESNLILFWVTQSALNPPLDSNNIVDVYQ